jgi:hypothetical protein
VVQGMKQMCRKPHTVPDPSMLDDNRTVKQPGKKNAVSISYANTVPSVTSPYAGAS